MVSRRHLFHRDRTIFNASNADTNGARDCRDSERWKIIYADDARRSNAVIYCCASKSFCARHRARRNARRRDECARERNQSSVYSVAAKTGTAQTGMKNQYDNAWVEGFFPYDHPQYAFAVVLERGPSGAGEQAVNVMQQLFEFSPRRKFSVCRRHGNYNSLAQ